MSGSIVMEQRVLKANMFRDWMGWNLNVMGLSKDSVILLMGLSGSKDLKIKLNNMLISLKLQYEF